MSDRRLRLLVCRHLVREVRHALPPGARSCVDVRPYADDCGLAPVACPEAATSRPPAGGRATPSCGGAVLHMMPLDARQDVCTTPCPWSNGDLLVERSLHDRLTGDGAYIVTPGWLADWCTHLDRLGFDRRLAREYFAECASSIVLLDTGLDGRAGERLQALGDHLELPVRRVTCGLGRLRRCLARLIRDWQRHHTCRARHG